MIGLFLGLIMCGPVYSVEKTLLLEKCQTYLEWQNQFDIQEAKDWRSDETSDFILKNINIVCQNIEKSINQNKSNNLWQRFSNVIAKGFAQYIQPVLICSFKGNKKIQKSNEKLDKAVENVAGFLWNMAMCAHPDSERGDITNEFLGYLYPGVESSHTDVLDLTLPYGAPQDPESIVRLIDINIENLERKLSELSDNIQNKPKTKTIKGNQIKKTVSMIDFYDDAVYISDTNNPSNPNIQNAVNLRELLQDRLVSIRTLEKVFSVVTEMSKACSEVSRSHLGKRGCPVYNGSFEVINNYSKRRRFIADTSSSSDE